MKILKAFPAILLGIAAAASAATTAQVPVQLTQASFMEIDALVVSVKGRPNEEHRLRGLKSYKQGDYKRAIQSFESAAYHADKYSQHYLSLIRWYGIGVAPDRVDAYIWADLAAERGSKRLLAIREKMWSHLTPEQQRQALARGGDYYARYGDEAAKPRVESKMRNFARSMTGSRVGYRNAAIATGGGPVNGSMVVDTGSNAAAYAISVAGSADELYGREGGLTMLKTYWQEQDQVLDRGGSVEVGPLKTVRKSGNGPGGGGAHH